MLTTAQYQTLKAAINAETDPTFVGYRSGGATGAMADWYNTIASPNQLVWRSEVPVTVVYDSIDWTKFTPTDSPDNTATFTNRALVIQTKQMNLQNMLQGRSTIDATKANIRVGLRDAVIQLPSGANGAAVTAGGASAVTVLTALTRPATRGEVLFFAGSATTGTVTANLLGWEGALSNSDLVEAFFNT